MLSICIPIYNFEITPLINELHFQASKSGKQFEIIAIDDASADVFKNKNQFIKNKSSVKYEELPENVGRSRIRNLLKKKSKYPFLLFIDCDTLIIRNDFIDYYIKEIESALQNEVVICGGHNYTDDAPMDSRKLHWIWGVTREALNPAIRAKNPHQSFMTSNFVISSSILNEIPFNENLTGYGHEDTLLGYEMSKRGIPISHIDNPVLHAGLEKADVFLEKTRQSALNLLKLYDIIGRDKQFLDISKLLKTYFKLRKFKLIYFYKILFWFFKRILEKNLRSRNPKIFCLNIYKLGVISEIKRTLF